VATTTPRLGLTKPDGTDLVDINVINANYDILDNQLVTTVTPNYIINGAFDINQRAFTSATTSGTFGFDRWRLINAGGTATYSAQTFTAGTVLGTNQPTNFARIATTGQSGTTVQTTLRQYIEDVKTLAGQTVTISFWAKASSGTPKIAVEFNQIFGTGGSPSSNVDIPVGQVTLSTSWARYSLSFQVPSMSGKTFGTNNNDYLGLNLWVSAGSSFDARTGSLGVQNSTFDFWGVQLEAGPTATAFRRNANSLQGELAACQRYYYRAYADGNGWFGPGAAASTTTFRGHVGFPVTMRAAPAAVETTGTAGNYSLLVGSAFIATAIVFSSSTTRGMGLNMTSSGMTAGVAGMFRSETSNVFLGFSVEYS
jgi:hypothetical protein